MQRADVEWALVADGKHARVLERQLSGTQWAERSGERAENVNPRSHETGRERPGRVGESSGTMRHAIQPRTDPHRESKRDFACLLTARLEAAALEGRYASLLLVAPPAFLGDLRAALQPEATHRLRGSLDKDLTHAPVSDIAGHLAHIEGKASA